jgi:hypothetical protein
VKNFLEKATSRCNIIQASTISVFFLCFSISSSTSSNVLVFFFSGEDDSASSFLTGDVDLDLDLDRDRDGDLDLFLSSPFEPADDSPDGGGWEFFLLEKNLINVDCPPFELMMDLVNGVDGIERWLFPV